MACDRVPWFYLFEGWFSTPAYIHHLQASRLKTTAGRRINGLGNFASNFRYGPCIGGVGDRNCGYEGLCIGMIGLGDHVLGYAQFHDPTQIHDH